MAPNTLGNKAVSINRVKIHLCELALDFANKVLGPKGQFVVKFSKAQVLTDSVTSG